MANTQEPHSKIYRTQGATAQVFSSGSQLQVTSGAEINLGAGATANFTSGAVKMPGSLAKGYLDLGPYLFAAKVLASAETMTTADMPMTLISSGDSVGYINWASADVAAYKLPPIRIPDDLSTADGLTIGLMGETIGSATAADAKQACDILCLFDVGDTECGATHPDFTSTILSKSITVASGDVTTGVLNIKLKPEAHAGRAIRVYGGRIEYTKKTS